MSGGGRWPRGPGPGSPRPRRSRILDRSGGRSIPRLGRVLWMPGAAVEVGERVAAGGEADRGWSSATAPRGTGRDRLHQGLAMAFDPGTAQPLDARQRRGGRGSLTDQLFERLIREDAVGRLFQFASPVGPQRPEPITELIVGQGPSPWTPREPLRDFGRRGRPCAGSHRRGERLARHRLPDRPREATATNLR